MIQSIRDNHNCGSYRCLIAEVWSGSCKDHNLQFISKQNSNRRKVDIHVVNYPGLSWTHSNTITVTQLQLLLSARVVFCISMLVVHESIWFITL